MRHRRTVAIVLPLAAALLAAMGGPTPVARGAGADEGGLDAVGDAGSALALMRVLPGSVPKDSILPELAARIPQKTALEAGFGITSAQANSDARLNYERAVAQATYGGATATGGVRTPGTLVQTALPDNPAQTKGALPEQPSPLDDVVRAGPMTGSAHARWSSTGGPCVDTIAHATAKLTGLRLGSAVPTVPDILFGELDLPKGRTLAKGFTPTRSLGSLGGLLAGTEPNGGSLVSVPEEFSSSSTMRLIDQRRTETKAVHAAATVRAGELGVLRDGPLGLRVRVRRAPTLEAVSTGSAETSEISYTKPVLEVRRGSKMLFRLDDRKQSEDIAIGVPTKGFETLPGSKGLRPLPIVGGAGATTKGTARRLTEQQQSKVLDLFVLRLSIAGLDQKAKDMVQPFEGHQLGASARLLDVQLLPTKALVSALGDRGAHLPSALLQLSLGELVASAFAPKGGVNCGLRLPPAPARGAEGAPGALRQTSAPFVAGPVFYSGAIALLAGVALLIAVVRRPRTTPSPHPRE